MSTVTMTIDDSEDDYLIKQIAMVRSWVMQVAIDSYYSEIFRPFKHRELDEKQVELLEELKEKFQEHFGDLKQLN